MENCQKLTMENMNKLSLRKAGCYKICYNKKIIYIGQSDNLEKRLNTLYNGIEKKKKNGKYQTSKTGHVFANFYNIILALGGKPDFGRDDLYFYVKMCDNKGVAEKVEAEQLKNHLKKYCSLPTFNRSIPQIVLKDL